MREFTDEEIQHYNQFCQHSISFSINSPDSEFQSESNCINDDLQSIQNLTHNFLTSLQRNFQGTISTIFRTGDKLNSMNDNKCEIDEEKCIMCHGKIDAIGPTLQATEFSKLVSSEAREKLEINKIFEVENIRSHILGNRKIQYDATKFF